MFTKLSTSALTLRKVSHSRDRKLRFLFRLFFAFLCNALGVIVSNGLRCHRNLCEIERNKSSTFREMTAIKEVRHLMLVSENVVIFHFKLLVRHF